MSHAGFIAAAYVASALVLAGLFLWIVVDGRAQRRRLADLEARRRWSCTAPPPADLEARGIRRRSVGTPT
jgi:heme exporter protein D